MQTKQAPQWALEFDGVSKFFDRDAKSESDFAGVRDVCLQIKSGEFFAVLGPSGCGKTTCLRLISGLETPSAGHIKLLGRVVNGVHPHKRNVHMVFQKYALFPHLNVFDNVAFGMRMKRLPESEVKHRVMSMLEMVHLGAYAKRSTLKLSGGEQQRVALVRALVNEPDILLLDEPLGALDQKLREEMQTELLSLQKKLGITFIFVTHDQNEALNLADRIAIMNQGRLVQVGTPEQVYNEPQNEFVARFVGASNLFDVRPTTDDGVVKHMRDGTDFSLRVIPYGTNPTKEGSERLSLMIRPENLQIVSKRTEPHGSQNWDQSFEGTVVERVFLGSSMQYRVHVPTLGKTMLALVPNRGFSKRGSGSIDLGSEVFVGWSIQDAKLL